MGSLMMRAPKGAATGGTSAAADGALEGMMMHEWSYETQARFLRELERLEPPPLPRSILPQRSDLLKLYANFFRTPHFAHWWERRRERADAGLAPAAEPPTEGEGGVYN